MKKRITSVVVLVLLLAALVQVSAADPIVIKMAFTDSAMTTIGDNKLPHPSYAAMLAFQNSVQKASGGKIVAELYPGGVLGDANSNMEQILTGQLQCATPADGAVAPFYENIQAFAIPYLFKDASQAYDLLDSDVATEIFEDMAATSGFRILAAYDNGGFRNFSNSKRVVKSAADMEGLKIRTMDITAHMEMVKTLGAAPTPIAFLELYSALQTGVVDGQENSAITTLSASLQEVQDYYTLDGHMLGIAYLVIGEEFFQGLTPELQESVLRAGNEAEIAARGAVRAYESLALAALAEGGMNIYSPTAAEMETFKVSQAPVIKYLKENINPDYVDAVLGYVENYDNRDAVAAAAPAATVAATTTAPAAAPAAQAVAPEKSSNTLTIILIAVIALLVAYIVYKSVKKKS